MIKDENINIPGKKPLILVAPLDWGLGHATRCIPIIFKLSELNCEVLIAAEGAGKILLQNEFPYLNFIELKGYRMRYSHTRFGMPLRLMLQFPKLFLRVYGENRWLRKTVEEYKIDAVISDNRPGLHHKNIPCIYITHQLQIKTGNRFSERITQKIHYHFINKYRYCWVPDSAGEINLAGVLSHPAVFPKTPVTYIGPLSRFKKKDLLFKYDLCIILSGPEPQRTVFEKLILKQLDLFSGKVLLLRGLPEKKLGIELNSPSLEIKNHLPADELNLVIQQSKLVLCRSGYTSVMDLIKLQKKAILVPTPGQTEQEYLAGYLMGQHLFYCTDQKNFLLQEVLKNVIDFSFNEPAVPQAGYDKVIDGFIKTVKKINSAGI